MSKAPYITKEKEQEIVIYMQQYKYKPEEICEEFQVSRTTVYTIMRRYGIDNQQKSFFDRMSSADLDALVKMYDEAVPWREISQRFDAAEDTLREIVFGKMGVVPRALRKEVILAERVRIEEAVDMYRAGWVLWFVQDITGVPIPKISSELQKRGWGRGAGNKGNSPAVDPITGQYIVDAEGEYLSKESVRKAEQVARTRKLTAVEEETLKGLGGLSDG